MESMSSFSKLFEDKKFYNSVMEEIARESYKDLRSEKQEYIAQIWAMSILASSPIEWKWVNILSKVPFNTHLERYAEA